MQNEQIKPKKKQRARFQDGVGGTCEFNYKTLGIK